MNDHLCFGLESLIQPLRSTRGSNVNVMLSSSTSSSTSFTTPSSTFSRAAARCNKGMEVLLAVALEHFVLVVVRVLRGPTQADEAAKRLRQLIHCQWCEERVFLKRGSLVDGQCLNTSVHTDTRQGNTALHTF